MKKSTIIWAVSGIAASLFILDGVLGEIARRDVAERQGRIVSFYGDARDACDEAYGKGARIKSKSLAEEGSSRFLPTPNAEVRREGDHIIVVLVKGRQACRLEIGTYKVLEKL